MTTKAKGKRIPKIYEISNQLLRYGAIWCVVLVLAISAAQSASAATFTVTTTADNGDNAAPTTGSLREAINLANATAGADTINFGVAGTITPPVSLPTITQPVTIDASLAAGAVSNTGATGSGFNGTLVVELNGAMAGDGGIGLRISAGGSVVRGLVINRFREAGIRIDTGTGTGIFGNFIGTATNGTVASGNFNRGILIVGSTGNQIGSTAPADSNVISGNSGTGISITAGGSATISRNFIGTDRNGTADLGNTQEGIRIVDSSGSTIGGANSDARNIISGNDGSGISIIQSGNRDAGGNLIPASNNVISANFIGVDVTGNAIQIIGTGSTFQTSPVSNSGSGVLINAAGNTVGGGRTTSTTFSTCENACNVISGNRANGISISSNFSTGNTVTGNNIGVGANGTTAIGNRDNGIQISNLAASSTIGGTSAANGICNNGCNVIANNGDPVNATSGRAGVYIDPTARASNTIRGNSIFTNTGLGIDLGAVGTTANDTLDPDTGANNQQNFPMLNSANTAGTIGGTLNSTANTTFAIDFYLNNASDGAMSEARMFIGTIAVTTNAMGNATISFNAGGMSLTAGQFVTATATSTGGTGAQAIGDTSEISNAQAVQQATAGGAAGLESDVAPRPNGDGRIISGDITQTRRFVNGTDTPDPNTNEFQRADSAPFATFGDGMLLSGDVVQARRYENGSDAPQPANGPTTRATPTPSPAPPPAGAASRESRFAREGKVSKTEDVRSAPTAPRELRVESASGRTGQQVTVNVRVDAMGDEAEYGFILNYDSSRLSNPVVGAGNAGAATRACNIGTAGRVNCSVGGFPTNQAGSSDAGIGEIALGNNQILITVTFTIAANAPPGTTPLTLTNVNTANDRGTQLAITGMNGTVTIAAARALRVESVTARSGEMVTVNLRVDAVGDEANYGFRINYDTSRLTNPVIGAGNAGAATRACNLMTVGLIRCSVGDFPNNQMGSSDSGIGEIAPGDNQILLTITFTIPNTAPSGQAPLTFENVADNPNVSNDFGTQLPIAGQGGFVNVNGPTAAGVTVTGRVLAGRRIIANARVSLTNGAGITRVATTDRNGYYRFDDVAAGETYVFAVRSARRYEFATQVVNITENTDNLNFNAEQ